MVRGRRIVKTNMKSRGLLNDVNINDLE